MITVRKADERGRTKLAWLDSWHSFSFGDYRDRAHVSFGPLRVINEDVIAPGGGFAPHSHRDMEIVTYILSGALVHEDSLGNGSKILPGEVQRMSAGTGITHSEFNASDSEPCHLLQIWLHPHREDRKPSYEQKRLPAEAAHGVLVPVAVPETEAAKHPQAVAIGQDATIYAGKLAPGADTKLTFTPGRRCWIQLAKGKVEANAIALDEGDGAAITGENLISLKARTPSEVLVFDLP